MKKLSIFGPPGTGKTTYLMELLSKELEHIPAHLIAFVSFTRKGTYEGAERAKKKFSLKKPDLRYFRTIHSLCFSAISANRLDMIDKKHYKLLSTKTGISFTGYYTEDFTSTNDAYLHAIAMEKHNPSLSNKMRNQLLADRYEYIKFQYGEMKAQLGILDFDDLLLRYLEEGEPLPAKVAFIDEAQDLTPLQWKVVHKMFSKAERVYVAGDDDQAVYEWSGADVNGLINFSDESLVLNKSYRLPEKILKLSKKVVRDIGKRKSKKFNSNGNAGEIDVAGSLLNVDFKGGELVLARTNWLLRQLSFKAISNGMLFKFKGKLSASKEIINAIKAYEAFCSGSAESVGKFRHMFHRIDNNTHWTSVIKLPPHEILYYDKLISRGWLEKTPIDFETFHSCKGSENEHVIVSCDMSKRVHDNFFNNRDSELRCLYVGLTRSKNRLTLLSPSEKEHYPIKYFE